MMMIFYNDEDDLERPMLKSRVYSGREFTLVFFLRVIFVCTSSSQWYCSITKWHWDLTFEGQERLNVKLNVIMKLDFLAVVQRVRQSHISVSSRSWCKIIGKLFFSDV